MKIRAAGVHKTFLVVACVLFAVALSGITWEQLAARRDRRAYPPPGDMVEVDGHRLHMLCSGAGHPSVILEAGNDESSLLWYLIQPEVAKFTRVCSVDRAGMGWSEAGPPPRTAQKMAEELQAQLQRGGVTGSYVLVGHSFGGFVVRMYASMYPADVAGIVLVDGDNEDFFTRFFPELRHHPQERGLKFLLSALSAPFGIPRLLGPCGKGPARISAALRATECQPRFFYASALEWFSWDESANEVRRAGKLGNLSLIVISSDSRFNKLGGRWDRAQAELTSLSTHSSQIIVAGSGHMIPYDRPDAVISAIRQLIGSRAQESGRAAVDSRISSTRVAP